MDVLSNKNKFSHNTILLHRLIKNFNVGLLLIVVNNINYYYTKLMLKRYLLNKNNLMLRNLLVFDSKFYYQ